MNWSFRKLRKHTIDELDDAIRDLKVLVTIDWDIWYNSWLIMKDLWKDFESGKFNTGAYGQPTRNDEENLITKMVDSMKYEIGASSDDLYMEIEQFFKLLWWYHVIDKKTNRKFRSICKRMGHKLLEK